jgi:pimeloyl-ACP methyl ester carboxylesterase
MKLRRIIYLNQLGKLDIFICIRDKMDLVFVIVARKVIMVFGAFILGACSKELLLVPSSDGVPIVYEAHGFGEPTLVFVHGWSCDRSYWNAQVKPFSQKYQVITIDLAGHGESGHERDDWTIESFGDDVASVVKKLGLKEVILIGHSMGGDVIAAAAKRLSNRVKGLVWVDVYNKLGTYRTSEQVETFIAPFRNNFKEKTEAFARGMFPPGANSSLVARVAKDMSSAPPDIALAAMRSAITNDRKITEDLRELKLQVIAINPAQPPGDSASMKPYGVKVVPMPGVGHFLMMERPDEFNKLLFEAIDKILGKG